MNRRQPNSFMTSWHAWYDISDCSVHFLGSKASVHSKFLLSLEIELGGLAQVVERSICIREAPGSIPGFSSIFSLFLTSDF